jgi:hypothetical protein
MEIHIGGSDWVGSPSQGNWVSTVKLSYIWGRFHQLVYTQLLRAKIPKAQKYSQVISVVLRFWNLRS